MKTDFVLAALEQAVWVRSGADGTIRPRDAGSPYPSIRDTERLAGAVPSAGSVGNSYDDTLAEAIIGPYQPGVIHPGGSWKPWRTPPWNGWTGSITAGYWSQSDTYSRRNWKGRNIANAKGQPSRPDSTSTISGKTGVGHPEFLHRR